MRALLKRMLPLVMAFMLLLSATVFAGNGEVVKTPGYSISNVTEKLGEKHIGNVTLEAYVVDSPATITLLNDYQMEFEAYKITKLTDGYFQYDDDKALQKSGKASVYVPDSSGALNESGYPKEIEKIIDVSEVKNYTNDEQHYLKGCSINLTEPGDYYVTLLQEARDNEKLFITVKSNAVSTVLNKNDEKVNAASASSKVVVNGQNVSFDAYNIGGNNYFKLRDIAYAVKDTNKKFGVTYDAEKKAISLTSNSEYVIIGGELTKGDGKAKTGILNTSPIYMDGNEVKLGAYNINGNNYFKLRDLAKAFKMGVSWNETTKTIEIDTTKEYTE